jgi:hypothetical protein
MGKVLFIVLAIFLLLGVFATPILDGVKSWRTQDVTENFVVTTASGVTTSNITIGQVLFQSDVAQVLSVTSNDTGEAPVATAYYETTNKLLMSALNPSTTRTLTVNYYAESESSIMQALGPFLGIFIIGALIVTIFMQAKKGR